MSVIGFDLGGTKLGSAVFNNDGKILSKEVKLLEKRKGKEVGNLIKNQVKKILSNNNDVEAIGISVPGISYSKTGIVWAPNISGWDNYPLLEDIKTEAGDKIKIKIDSDRACYILGEVWRGIAHGCHDAIFISVGTGIGAGILVNGEILRGSNDIAGAIGWLALDRPFMEKYIACGCFEYHASGAGIAKVAREFLKQDKSYKGTLRKKEINKISAHDIFEAYKKKDILAEKVLKQSIEFWGMTTANLISLFNPEKIIFGGGVFGPALQFLNDIMEVAKKWAQPVSINQVKLEGSKLGGDAGIYGAGYLALKSINKNKDH
jgi:glucokinase